MKNCHCCVNKYDCFASTPVKERSAYCKKFKPVIIEKVDPKQINYFKEVKNKWI